MAAEGLTLTIFCPRIPRNPRIPRGIQGQGPDPGFYAIIPREYDILEFLEDS